MGSVHRARHVETGAVHALKVVPVSPGATDDAAAARFAREVESLGRVADHPGIASVHGTGVAPGVVWLAMELVEGESLATLLSRRGALPPNEAARVIAALARAVAHVHGHGVIHRDIKPENVILDAVGRPRLIDFGIAYDSLEASLTRAGEAVGTPIYMAPEQMSRERGGGALGPTTDVYGLGATLWACVAGREPFAGELGPSLVFAVMRRTLEPPSMVAGRPATDLDAVCRRAMAKAPGERYPSCEALAVDLERFASGQRVRAPRRRRRGVAIALAGVLIVAGSVALGVGLTGRAGPDTGRAAELEADWRAALGRLEAGETSGLDEADAVLALAPAEGRDPWNERRRLVRELRALCAGDAVSAVTVAVDRPPWAGRQELLATMLLAYDRADVLDRIAERSTLAEDPHVFEAVGRAAARSDGRDDGAVEALVTLAARAEATVPLRRIDALRFDLLSRWLERRLAAGGVWDELRPDWRDEVVRALVVDERRRFRSSEASFEALSTVIDEPRTPISDRIAIASLLAASSVPVRRGVEDDELARRFAIRLVGMRLAFMIEGDRRAAFELSCVALRTRFWGVPIRELGSYEVPEDHLIAELAIEGRLPAERRSPTRIASLIMARVEAHTRSAASGTPRGGSRGWSPFGGRAIGVQASWKDIEGLLELDELGAGEWLPSWALAWLATRFGELEILRQRGSADQRSHAEDLIRREHELVARFPSVIGHEVTGERSPLVIQRLFDEARRRERAQPPGRRLAQIPLAQALQMESGRYAEDPIEVVLEALRWVDARREIYEKAASVSGRGVLRELESALYWTFLRVALGGHEDDRHDQALPCRACDRIEASLGEVRLFRPKDPLVGLVGALLSWTHHRHDEALRRLEGITDDQTSYLGATLVFGARMLVNRGELDEAREVLRLTDGLRPREVGIADIERTTRERLAEAERAAGSDGGRR